MDKLLEEIREDLLKIKKIIDFRLQQLDNLSGNLISNDFQLRREEIIRQAEETRRKVLQQAQQATSMAQGAIGVPFNIPRRK